MSNPSPADIAAELRAEMGRQRVTQAKLADVLGVSQPQVSDRMLGTVDWRVTELIQVAEFLGVPVTRFLAGPEASKTHPTPTRPTPTRPVTPPPPPPPPPPTKRALSESEAA
ncbi:helix-turn-helix domain-containing protein [Rhizomonospora bruguierae]|uniref:helix-turn-helix domain-containing protein n=1 Tax=Rhizomonospora bruguierae TaxID=1581705 RepID=UPI001BCCDF47|nr:helix-turn-helix transcriptional regulator [Micromonospora sp. NBRC 107566]